jgi:hypothetical protein
MSSIRRLLGILLILLGTAGTAFAFDEPGGNGRDNPGGGKKGDDRDGKKEPRGDDRRGGNLPRGVPEIDAASAVSGLALLSGLLLVIRGDRRINE